MSRAQIILNSKRDFDQLWRICSNAQPGTRVEIKKPKRTLPQNDRLWLMLTEISKREWHGKKYAPTKWKVFFMHALADGEFMPDEDGQMIPIGLSTSDLEVEKFAELMELIQAFCARQEIKLPWDDEVAA